MNKLKLITALSLFVVLHAFALDFYPQKFIQNPTAAQKKVKWSNTEWGNSHDFDTNMPKGFKPGPFDGVHMRHYGQTLTVDEDISIGTLASAAETACSRPQSATSRSDTTPPANPPVGQKRQLPRQLHARSRQVLGVLGPRRRIRPGNRGPHRHHRHG